MRQVTYMYMKEKEYYLGSAADMIHALRICKEQGALEVYILRGDVENTIRSTGVKKVFNLVRIVDKYNLQYENTY